MYAPDTVARFYDEYGEREWERLDASAHARLIYHLHLKFLQGHIGRGRHVADVGCGGGRFSVPVAQSGSRITLIDLSPEQIQIARSKMASNGLEALVAASVVADICNLQVVPDAAFDTVICFGGVLNYLLEQLPQGLAELRRITRPGGTILLSVNSRWGLLRFAVANPMLDPATFFGNPAYWRIFEVAETGDLPKLADLKQPARHFFTAAELSSRLTAAGLDAVEIGAAPAAGTMLYDRLAAVEKDARAWGTLLKIEEQACFEAGLLDSGEFLMARGVVTPSPPAVRS